MRSGVVVAGGQSRRFGETDKALAELAGTPMIRRVADRISAAVDELVVNCRPAQTAAIRTAMVGYPLAVSYVEDEVPDRGPVAGIRNGLATARGRHAFLVACDMPFVDPALCSYLFEVVDSFEAAIPRLEANWLQRTQAVYRVDPTVDACTKALETGNPSVLEVLEQLDYVVVDEPELETVTSLDTFENLNTRAQFEAAANRLDQ
ncbi:MAG: molybdenum cofactor guanylyltransferase [Halovenus sp.]